MIPYAIRGILWDQGESGTGLRCIKQPMLMSTLKKSPSPSRSAPDSWR